MYKFYDSQFKRIAMRFLEIFIIAGAIGLMQSNHFVSLIPAAYVGLVAALIKTLREVLNEM